MLTPVPDVNIFLNLGRSILDSVADTLACNSLDVPERRYVGFDRPPQDCCPELVAWVSNIRVWDGLPMDGRQSGELICVNGWAFDVTMRIGRCYIDIDVDANGFKPMSVSGIEEASEPLYKDAAAMYFGFIAAWKAGNITELTVCDAVNVSAMSPYHEGGCAGWEFTISVGVI